MVVAVEVEDGPALEEAGASTAPTPGFVPTTSPVDNATATPGSFRLSSSSLHAFLPLFYLFSPSSLPLYSLHLRHCSSAQFSPSSASPVSSTPPFFPSFPSSAPPPTPTLSTLLHSILATVFSSSCHLFYPSSSTRLLLRSTFLLHTSSFSPLSPSPACLNHRLLLVRRHLSVP